MIVTDMGRSRFESTWTADDGDMEAGGCIMREDKGRMVLFQRSLCIVSGFRLVNLSRTS